MQVKDFMAALQTAGIEFYAGVPDSLLAAFCDSLAEAYGTEAGGRHVVAHNEGGAVALAAGYYMATRKIPCVYMQNSGIGNVVNPAASLIHPDVYGIPLLFVIGWRGEPGVKDEPQHVFQGKATLPLLQALDIRSVVVTKEMTPAQLQAVLAEFSRLFAIGSSAALVIKKGALENGPAPAYKGLGSMRREAAIEELLALSGEDIIVSSTGKISREVFEIRERRQSPHKTDFLTVGSMGHSVMIALGVARSKPQQRVWCLDGDGAVLMHMGALTMASGTQNLLHVVLNNGAHETVGGMPTAAQRVQLAEVARACGYANVFRVEWQAELTPLLRQAMQAKGPVFVEIMVALGSRPDLIRPTTTSDENRRAFMSFLEEGV